MADAEVWGHADSVLRTARTDGVGTFRLVGLPAKAEVSRMVHMHHEMQLVLPVEGSIIVRVPNPVPLRLRLVDQDGRPFKAHGHVTLMGPGFSMTATVDRGGRVEAGYQPPGRWRILVFSTDSGTELMREFILPESEAEGPIIVDVPSTKT